MIPIETVLVLGAGASKPYGFPLGWGLLSNIYEGIKHSRQVFSLLHKEFGKEKLMAFAENLVGSGEESVDAFLEYQESDFVEIGKAAIATELLPHESMINLYHYWLDTERQIKAREEANNQNSWYHHLWKQLNAPFEEFQNNKLGVITFNYDRSLEQFLFTTLKNKYSGKSDEQYAKKLRHIPIIHVHGKLGPLPWEIPNATIATLETTVPFGMSSERIPTTQRPAYIKKWLDIARKNIKVIHENISETEEFKQAKELISNAKQLFFLGFGYHPTNLTRLGIDTLKQWPKKPAKVRGTCYGLGRTEIRNVERLEIAFLQRRHENFLNEKVYDFLHKYVDFNE